MKNENAIIWEQFLSESPWITQQVPDQFNIDMSNISIEKIKSNSKIGFYKDFEIYENVDGYETSLYFLKDDIFTAFYKYIKTELGNIQTKLIWNDKKYKGSFLDIFANYIIPRFKIIESDDMMTPQAFDMWKSLMLLKPEYKFYVKREDKILKLESPYDVHLYKERMGLDDKENTTFVVQE
jgi:hypothetical protein